MFDCHNTLRFSSKASAVWKTLVNVSFDGNRLYCTSAPAPITYSAPVHRGQPRAVAMSSAQEMLKQLLGNTVQVRNVRKAFQPLETLLATYRADHPDCQFSGPVFNDQGDFLVQVASHTIGQSPEVFSSTVTSDLETLRLDLDEFLAGPVFQSNKRPSSSDLDSFHHFRSRTQE